MSFGIGHDTSDGNGADSIDIEVVGIEVRGYIVDVLDVVVKHSSVLTDIHLDFGQVLASKAEANGDWVTRKNLGVLVDIVGASGDADGGLDVFLAACKQHQTDAASHE